MPADEVQDKFRDNAKRALPSGRIEAIINVVDQLEELSRVSELMTICIAPNQLCLRQLPPRFGEVQSIDLKCDSTLGTGQ
jgi:hypothetical protein